MDNRRVIFRHYPLFSLRQDESNRLKEAGQDDLTVPARAGEEEPGQQQEQQGGEQGARPGG